jgi:predicted dehydrogenase
MSCGIVGMGRFGQHHLAKLSNIETVQISGVYDPFQSEAIRGVASKVSLSFCELLARSDAIFVCSPASSHFGVAMQALDAGCHVYVEKPLGTTLQEAERIANFAVERQLVLQVGHQERLVLDDIGFYERVNREYSLSSARNSNAGTRSSDVSVAFDLMIHDLDAIFSLEGDAVCGEYALRRHQRGALTWDKVDISFTNGVGTLRNMLADRTSSIRKRTIEARNDAKNEILCFDMNARSLMLKRGDGNCDTEARILHVSNLIDPLAASIETFLKRIDGKADRRTALMEQIHPALSAVALAERIDAFLVGKVEA